MILKVRNLICQEFWQEYSLSFVIDWIALNTLHLITDFMTGVRPSSNSEVTVTCAAEFVLLPLPMRAHAMPRGTLLSHACICVSRDSKTHFVMHWINRRYPRTLCTLSVVRPDDSCNMYLGGCHCISYPLFDKVPIALHIIRILLWQWEPHVRRGRECVVIHIGSCSNR